MTHIFLQRQKNVAMITKYRIPSQGSYGCLKSLKMLCYEVCIVLKCEIKCLKMLEIVTVRCLAF